MQAAVLEWNVVQATLRQTSCKLSEFLAVLASSRIISMILFAYQVVSLSAGLTFWVNFFLEAGFRV